MTFANLLDPQSQVSRTYGVRGIPANFFINQKGQIVGYANGYRKWDSQEGQALIQEFLQESE